MSQTKLKSMQTENRQKQSIEEIKRQWMATVDAMEDGVVWVDQDYNIHKLNKSFASESKTKMLSQLIGKKCYEVFANRTSACQNCHMKKALEKNTTLRYEIVRDNGEKEHSFEVTAQPIHDENSSTHGMIVVYRDQTEAKMLRQQLLQSEKLNSIGNLAGGIAHELNNPLAGILAFAQVIKRELPKESNFHSDVEEIIHAARRCRNIVKDLLFFARNHKSTQNPINPQPTNLCASLQRALRLVSVGMQREFSKINLALPDMEKEILVSGNEDQLIQVFINLITNSAQALQKKKNNPSIDIQIDSKDPDKITVTIDDNGSGIPEKDLPHIFEPFFTTKEVGQGTGLGLSVTYGIIKDLKGNISITSQYGLGTTAKVTLNRSHSL